MIIPRDKYLQELRSVMHNGMIKIITGVRRCGKSYLLFELFKQSLLENGVNEEHIIQVDLEDRRNKHLREPDRLLDHIDGHITDNDMYYILLYLEVIDYQLFAVNTVEKWIGFYLWVHGK